MSRRSRGVGTVSAAVAIFAVWAQGGCATRTNDSVVARVGATEVSAHLAREKSGVLLIDARPVEEFRTATIPGAIHLRLSDIEEGRTDPRLSRHSGFVVFGQNPVAGAPVAIAKRMIASGYEGVSLFEGGMDAWRSAGGQTVPGRQVGLPAR